MNKSSRIAVNFANILGIFLIAEGFWGLFSKMVFGYLSTNLLHASIHIVLGIIAVLLARAGKATGFLTCLGILLLVVGIMRLVPSTNALVVSLLNVNLPVAFLNIVLGMISLIIAIGGRGKNDFKNPTIKAQQQKI